MQSTGEIAIASLTSKLNGECKPIENFPIDKDLITNIDLKNEQ